MFKIIVHHTKNITHLSAKMVKYAGHKTLHLFFPPAIHYLTDKYKDKYHHLIADSIIAMVVIIMVAGNIGLGYWFYHYFTPAEMDLRVGQSAFVISGQELEYTINYFNKTKTVDDFQVKVLYPQGFTPADGVEDYYNLGTLEKNDFGEIKIQGTILGDVGQTQQIKVVYGYTYEGNAFQGEIEHEYKIQNSSFEIYTEMPETILQQEEFIWKVKYTNNSALARKDVKVKLDLPANLEIMQTNFEYDAVKQEITIPEVDAKAAGEIELTSKFTDFGDVDNVITITTSLSKATESYVQNISQDYINVLSPRLELSASVNGSVSAVANLGELIYYRVNYSNIGDIELKNINLFIDFDNYFEDRSFTIEALAPGQTKATTFAVNSNPAWRVNNLMITNQISATAQIGDLAVRTYSPTTTTEVKFNTSLDFVTRASYYGPNGEQLGYGPYPPEAGEITALRLFWQVEDITNSLSNVTIKATLPSQVEWTGATSVSAGTNISYDSNTREVLWHVGSLAAFTHPQGASFELRVLPNWQQIGQKINLTNTTMFTAIDAFTGSYLERRNTPVQTENIVE